MTLDDFAADCTRTARDLRDTQGLFRECAAVVNLDMAAGIVDGVAPNGSQFKPLAHPRPGGGGGGPLFDSGGLATSLMSGPDHVVVVTRSGFTVGTKKLGARLMQDGGWVLPKRTKFLAIPATAAAKAAGSPRNVPGLRPRVGVKGGVLVDESGAVQFYLVRSVYVPARPAVGVSQRALAKVVEKITDFVSRAFKRGR